MFIKKAKTFLWTCLLSFVLCSIFTAKTFGQQGGTLRVDNSATGTGDGLSWPNAIISLHIALNTANTIDGDWEIRVAKGNGPYKPIDKFSPFLISGKTGIPGDTITLLGGYAGDGAPNPDLRDPKAFPTILSGDLDENDLDFGSRFDNEDGWLDPKRSENAFTVLHVLNTGPNNRIDGFIIEGGAKGTEFQVLEQRYGGGMFIVDSAIDVVNCTFRYNSVGIPGDDCDPPFPCFNGNDGIGGGAMVIGSHISGLEFTRFINCVFHDNLTGQGCGLALVDLSIKVTQATVLNSLFHDNRAIEMTNTFAGEVFGHGGAIIVYGQDKPGSPALSSQATIDITNCTVVNNWAEKSKGGFFLWDAADNFESVIQNSVFWHNDQGTQGPTEKGEIGRLAGTNNAAILIVRYSVVEGGLTPSFGGEGPLFVEEEITDDPMFVDEANKDFRLQSISPAVDSADPDTSFILLDDFDLNRNNDTTDLTPELGFKPRELDGDGDGVAIVDRGSYERFFTCCEDVAGFDHAINVTDLLKLLATWGACPDLCVSSTINTPTPVPQTLIAIARST